MNQPIRRLLAGLRAAWPWLLLLIPIAAAAWHAVDFPDDVDREFPRVVRPTFSTRPPPAYRLAEPGDTIDHIAIYFAAWGVALSAMGLAARKARNESAGLWTSALALSLGAFWYNSNPGPTFDGWHGLGFRALLDPATPTAVRLAISLGSLAFLLAIVLPWGQLNRSWATWWRAARDARVAGLLTVAGLGALLRQVEIPGVEPVGYWPRWAQVVALLAFDCALVRMLPGVAWRGRDLRIRLGSLGLGMAVIALGLGLLWFHRPIGRLKEVEPGKLYISAMPGPTGLAIAHDRHRFKTIINHFPEDLDPHPAFPAERQFAEDHGIRYIVNNEDPQDADRFLDETLAIAQDPDSWPVLIHCHACMDRTPAWLGIYRFVVQGRPLLEVMQEIERHRGYRPKASVVLLFNWDLPRLAPDRHREDPTAQLLMRCGQGRRLSPAEFMRIAGDVSPDASRRAQR
ncbi:MAG: protein tyrosine phosphatase [Isosphaeraceae bacterium]